MFSKETGQQSSRFGKMLSPFPIEWRRAQIIEDARVPSMNSDYQSLNVRWKGMEAVNDRVGHGMIVHLSVRHDPALANA